MSLEEGKGKWQFSIRGLLILTTGWAVLLSISRTIGGLEELPYIVSLTAAISAAVFVCSCLLAGSAKR
jgi:hypothetical protein